MSDSFSGYLSSDDEIQPNIRQSFRKTFYSKVNKRTNFSSASERIAFWKHSVCKYFIDENPTLLNEFKRCSREPKDVRGSQSQHRYTLERRIVTNEINRLYAAGQVDRVEELIVKFSTVYKAKFLETYKPRSEAYITLKICENMFYLNVNERINFNSIAEKKSFWKHWAFKYFIDDNPMLKEELAKSRTYPMLYFKKVERRIAINEINKLYSTGQMEKIEYLIKKFSTEYRMRFIEDYKPRVFKRTYKILEKKAKTESPNTMNPMPNMIDLASDTTTDTTTVYEFPIDMVSEQVACFNFTKFKNLVDEKLKLDDCVREIFWVFALRAYTEDEDIPIFYDHDIYGHGVLQRARYLPEYIDGILRSGDQNTFNFLVNTFLNYWSRLIFQMNCRLEANFKPAPFN
jgi:hypothetical protein